MTVLIENHILHNAVILCTDFGAWSVGLRASRLYFLDLWGDERDSSPSPSALPGLNIWFVDCEEENLFSRAGGEGDFILENV